MFGFDISNNPIQPIKKSVSEPLNVDPDEELVDPNPPEDDYDDPIIDPDDGTIPHEERDEEGRVIRERNTYIPIEERINSFQEEELTMLDESRKNRNLLGLGLLATLFFLSQ